MTDVKNICNVAQIIQELSHKVKFSGSVARNMTSNLFKSTYDTQIALTYAQLCVSPIGDVAISSIVYIC